MSSWRVSFSVPAPRAADYEVALEGLGALVIGLPTAPEETVPLELHLPTRPDETALAALLAAVAEAAEQEPPTFAVVALAERDWVGESQRALAPIRSGRFWVHGGHVQEPPPAGLMALRIEAAQAFGTGRHETTLGCLLALEDLAKRRRPPARVLDLGCGSGILALAAARLWPGARVLAADNDPVAVAVARDNARINRLAGRVEVLRAEGYRAGVLRGRGPFDLVVANILARPLAALAPGLRANLAPGGRAVLSGLLRGQEGKVRAPHEALGLRLVRRLHLGDWSVLVLRG